MDRLSVGPFPPSDESSGFPPSISPSWAYCERSEQHLLPFPVFLSFFAYYRLEAKPRAGIYILVVHNTAWLSAGTLSGWEHGYVGIWKTENIQDDRRGRDTHRDSRGRTRRMVRWMGICRGIAEVGYAG